MATYSRRKPHENLRFSWNIIVGAGLIDLMVLPSVDFNTGMTYDPVYVINDEEYPIPHGEEDKAIIYNIKANAALNSDIFSNIYVQVNNGWLKLLASEKTIREKLLSTKKGQKMSLYDREKFLLPYTMTSFLVDEMCNLKLKTGGASGQIAIEQISKRVNKDRFTALAYALFRVKNFEDTSQRKRKKKASRGFAAFLQRS